MRLSIIALLGLLLLACTSQKEITAQNEARFLNPILAGFYPDPSLEKVGDDYYLVNSTFAYFPGIPIFHSKDLVNWTQIGHVLDRPEQLNLDGFGVSRAIFAPAIKHHKGIFYVTCTLVDGGGNFVVTATNPAGPYSNPVWLPEVNGIDPSIFFENDKAYLLYNSDAPNNKPLYEGHRTIRMYEFDYKNLKIVGDNKILVNGGVDLSKKPIWIEGPHIYKRNGFYYLIPAEGGTAEDHSQVVFRSKNFDGPYIPWEKNPILTQRHLDPKRQYPITSTGHAAFVETATGDWWAVFLACRPYEPFDLNYYNTGRETFMAPVKWTDDDWPIINPGFEEVQYSYPVPLAPVRKQDIPLNGNFTLREDFNSSTLPYYWIFLRTPHEKWYSLQDGKIKINLRLETVAGKKNPSFITRRQQHAHAEASLSINFNPKSENEKAGLIVFHDERHFYYLCKSQKDNYDVVQLYKSVNSKNENEMELLAEQKLNSADDLFLKIKIDGIDLSFFFAEKEGNWNLLKDKVDASILSVKKAWAFVGSTFGMYATSLGNESSNSAHFDWFEYSGDDKVYHSLK
jgi:alpha-N-arabinofuranosidase